MSVAIKHAIADFPVFPQAVHIICLQNMGLLWFVSTLKLSFPPSTGWRRLIHFVLRDVWLMLSSLPTCVCECVCVCAKLVSYISDLLNPLPNVRVGVECFCHWPNYLHIFHDSSASHTWLASWIMHMHPPSLWQCTAKPFDKMHR